MSRAVASTPGLWVRRAPGRAAMKSMQGRSAPASSPATGLMVRVASGTISWPKAFAMESFFSSLKTERIARKTYRTRNQARQDVFD